MQMSTARRRRGGLPSGIGDRLREERERLGLSQEALGKQLGVDRRTIYNYEQERNPIPTDFLSAFGQSGGDLDYVVFGRTQASPPADDAEAVRRAVMFAAEFCREPDGRPRPIDDEVVEWIVMAYEVIAPARSEAEAEESLDVLRHQRRA